ncbi:unnamed protein product [Clavelina lepadiformis]|uniref:NadR/Ttd14 AAA domain-containing protein n=1 Tax=Clavelina lepadiformis TaxID=159417 RepID=A0ABP0FNT0_CLALP
MTSKLHHVFVSGVHSSGKTTLLNYIKENVNEDDLNISIHEEVARRVVVEEGYTQKKLQDKMILTQLNHAIVRRMYSTMTTAIEASKTKTSEKFDVIIWDRWVIDPLTYLLEYVSESEFLKATDSEEVIEMLELNRDKENSILFLLAPHREYLIDDGVRVQTGGFDSSQRFHEQMKHICQKFNIEFVEIEEKSLELRAHFVIEQIRKKWLR